MLEMFSQVKLNVPLLDAILQVPAYAKFLKDICTKKRKTNVPKKVFMATNISEILSGPILVKYKDPECPIISCTIEQTKICWALLDLGANINLLPLSVYQQLGLGELSPTRVIIQLADRSVKISRGKSHMSYPGRGFHLPCWLHCSWDPTCVKSKVSNSSHLRAPIPCYS